MRIMAVLVLILVLLSLNTAIADLTDDVSQALYFRSSAYIELNPKFAEFKQAMEQRDLMQAREIRSDRMKLKWKNMVYRDNDCYRQISKKMQTIKSGVTTEYDILSMIRKPIIVSDHDVPWIIAPWRLNEQILLGTYPYPRNVEKVLAGGFYYTAVCLPRFRIALDVMPTLNKATGLVDYSRNYLGTGTVPSYWLIKN